MKFYLRWYCLLLLVVSGRAVALTSTFEDRGSIMLSGGVSGIFDSERNPVVMLDYRFASHWKGARPWLGLSWATDGAVFAGGGVVYTVGTADGAWALSAGTGPGYYERHQGEDLGSHLEFCSFVEIARSLAWEHRVVLRLVHISNGGITERNPGAELLMLGYAMPLP
jgi:hypothetical protein